MERIKTPWSVWYRPGADQNALQRLVLSWSGSNWRYVPSENGWKCVCAVQNALKRLEPSWSGSKRPEAFGTVMEWIKTPCSVWFRHGAVQYGDMYRLKMVDNVYVRFKTPWSVWYPHGADQNALKRLVPSWSGSKRPAVFGSVTERFKLAMCTVWKWLKMCMCGSKRPEAFGTLMERIKTPWSVWYHHGADQNALKRLVPSCSGTKRDSNLLRADRTVHQHLIHNLTWMRLEPHFKTIGLFIFIDRNQLLDCERRERRVCGLKVLSKKCKVWPQPTVNIYEFEKILWKKAAIEHAIIR